MISPDGSMSLDVNAVVAELCADPLGRALWERAQWHVAADLLQRRVTELEAHQVSPPSQAVAP